MPAIRPNCGTTAAMAEIAPARRVAPRDGERVNGMAPPTGLDSNPWSAESAVRFEGPPEVGNMTKTCRSCFAGSLMAVSAAPAAPRRSSGDRTIGYLSTGRRDATQHYAEALVRGLSDWG